MRSALATADSLTQEGRFLEAIDLLTEANRHERDGEIESRLVNLRNAAYGELDRSPTSSPWPDDTALPRERDVALPPIKPEELTPEMVRDRILRYGCAYVPGLLAGEQVDRLVDGIDRAIEGGAKKAPGASTDKFAPWFLPFELPEGLNLDLDRAFLLQSGGVWTVESPRVMFDFLEMLEAAGLRSLIIDYLGERPALTLKKSSLRRVPPLPRSDWHQDGAFLGEGIRTINLWLSLSECGIDAPGLDILPRRLNHIVETGTGGAWFDWCVGPETVEREAGDTAVIRPTFEPGDALLFDELFLHRTATDETMSKDRYAIETWFFAPSVYPSDQIPFVW